MSPKTLLLLLMVVGVVVAVLVVRRGPRRSGPGPIALARPIMQMFFQQTGYAFADARQAPLLAQVDRWERDHTAHFNGAPYNIQLARNYQGLEISFQHAMSKQDRTLYFSQTWWTPPMPISAPFQVVQRSLLEGPDRRSLPANWQPAFPTVVMTGEPEFDQRFIVFSSAPEQRIRAILQNPRLRGALLACTYVDLRVLPERILFSDPVQSNTIAAMGGPSAAARILTLPGKVFELGLPVHERIADILLGASSLAR